VRAIFDLHDAIVATTARFRGEPLGYAHLCARRYFVQSQDEQCLSSSILRLWYFQRAEFELDAHWERTVARAHEESLIDLGSVTTRLDANGTAHLVSSALQISYYFDASRAEYRNGGLAAWEAALLEAVRAINEAGDALSLSYWSTKLNEKDASAVATKDLDVLCMTFGFILLYVCVTLGGFTTDRRKSRLSLGAFCGICTLCSLTSGFGICCFLGVPLAPMSTLVLFTLMGVSVDDMIILVDAFDRTSAQVSLEERIRVALAHAGTAVTMTSATTMVAFLSGVNVDLPSIQLFCAPAAASVFMVNVLQVTLFTALLVLDARRQASGELDCQRCVPDHCCVGGGPKRGAVAALGARDDDGDGGAEAKGAAAAGAVGGAAALGNGAPHVGGEATALGNGAPHAAAGVSALVNSAPHAAGGEATALGNGAAHAAPPPPLNAYLSASVLPSPDATPPATPPLDARPAPSEHALDGAVFKWAATAATTASTGAAACAGEDGEVGCTNSPLGRWWRLNYAAWLMQSRVRVAVLLVSALLVCAAGLLIPHLQLGLPMEATLPADSFANVFFRDVNRYWTGTQDFQIMLIIKDTDLTDHVCARASLT
jgi:hypothetical protein